MNFAKDIVSFVAMFGMAIIFDTIDNREVFVIVVGVSITIADLIIMVYG